MVNDASVLSRKFPASSTAVILSKNFTASSTAVILSERGPERTRGPKERRLFGVGSGGVSESLP